MLNMLNNMRCESKIKMVIWIWNTISLKTFHLF